MATDSIQNKQTSIALTPLFSVITPVYNGEKWISRCISSVIDQDFENKEMLIIDDGSTDKTFEILSEYANKHKWLRVIRRENRGYCATMNELVNKAKGEYILGVDSDNYLSPNVMKECFSIIQKHPSIDILQFDCVYFAENGAQVEANTKISSHVYLGRENGRNAIIDGEILSLTHGGKAIRRSLMKNFPFSGYPFGSDSRVTERAVLASNSIAVLHGCFLFASLRADSLSHREMPPNIFTEWLIKEMEELESLVRATREWRIPLVKITLLWMAYRNACVEKQISPGRLKDCGAKIWKNRKFVFEKMPLSKTTVKWFMCHHPRITGVLLKKRPLLS